MKVESVVFYSNNLLKVKDFYLNVLGLKLDYETPTFMSFLFPEGMKLGIKLKQETREIPGSQTVFLGIDNIEAEYKNLKHKACRFAKELTKEPWAYEFAILDPDGNKIEFRQSE